MREDYTSEEIEGLEGELKELIEDREEDTVVSVDLPSIGDGFICIDVYCGTAYDENGLEPGTVEECIEENYDVDVEVENIETAGEFHSYIISRPTSVNIDFEGEKYPWQIGK